MSLALLASLLVAPNGGAAVSLNSHRLPPSRMKFDFVALGDNRPAGAFLPPTKVFRGLLHDVGIIAPAFVVSSGDLIYGKEEPIAQFRVEAKQVKALLAALPCPFFNAPGNHEISDRPELYREYLKWFGPTFGSFRFGAFRFLQVSTEEVGSAPGISPAEHRWLEKMFATPGPKIAFQHHPIVGRKSNESPELVDDAEKVASFYKDGGVKYVFQGHDHAFAHESADGLEYFLSGGAGAPLDAIPTDGGFFHFLLVHVDGEKVSADVIPSGALEVSPSAGGVTVGNYADVDLPLGNVTVSVSRRPQAASGKVFRAKKVTDVPVRIVSVQRAKGGYLVRLSLVAPKHRATVIRLR
jgi:hypothetical protein